MSKGQRSKVLCIGNDPVHLNLRCALLREHGWNVSSSGNRHEGVLRFSRDGSDAVVLDLNRDDSEAALIAGELKRLRSTVPVILVVSEEMPLAAGSTEQADAVVSKSDSKALLDALRTLLSDPN